MLSHRECFACGELNTYGLHLNFTVQDDRTMAECEIAQHYQGYPGVVQGGIVSALLDSAMTNCLFQRGVEAMTAKLEVRYHQPILTCLPLIVEATLQKERGPIYELNAVIKQQGKLKASAVAKFLKARPAEIKGGYNNEQPSR